MSHKYVTQDQIEALQAEIRGCEESVARIRRIGSLASDTKGELVRQLKSFLKDAQDKKDMSLDLMLQTGSGNILPADIQEKTAILNRGQEKAFQLILDMIESPELAIQHYESEVEFLKGELKRKQMMEQRKS